MGKSFFSRLKPKSQDPWFKIENRGDKKARIDIFDNIGESFFFEGLTAKKFKKELDSLGQVDDIDLHINSNGGEVFQGFTIYEMLKQHNAKINVHIDGIAASIASVIAMAGDTINIAENGFFMMHAPKGINFGRAKDMRKHADLLDKMQKNIVNTYMNKFKGERNKLESMVEEETYLDANECLEHGFADEISSPVQAAAFAGDRYSNFANLPQALALAADLDNDDTQEIDPPFPPEKTDEEKKDEIQPSEEDEMTPEEVKQMLDEAIDPLKKENQDLKTELAEMKTSHGDLSKDKLSKQINSRLNVCVSQNRITPSERDSALLILDGVTDETKVDKYLKSLESRRSLGDNILTQEIIKGDGERKSVAVDRDFQIPRKNGPPRIPSMQAVALFDQVSEGTEGDFNKFRSAAYAAHGERLPSPVTEKDVASV